MRKEKVKQGETIEQAENTTWIQGSQGAESAHERSDTVVISGFCATSMPQPPKLDGLDR